MTSKKVLLVGWDSADWQIIHPLLDEGKLPGVQWLVEGGASGNLTTLEPQLSPMLWTSIATGKMAWDHGVAGFTEVDPVSGQVVPVSWATRKCRTVWEVLGQRGLRSFVVNWFATQGERNLNGAMVSNAFCHLDNVRPDQDPAGWLPPPAGTYFPESLAEEMNSLRVSPYEISPEEIVTLFVPDAAKVDQEKDQRLWALVKHLAQAFSAHAAATHLMEKSPDWNFGAIYYRTLDEICHFFMPYHPPKMEGVPEEDFAMYRGVVEAAYRLHDLFLQRLLQIAGPETTVILVSDHGFRSDHLRPKYTPNVPAGITVWHRQQGVLAIRGPGIKKDALVFGARLTDVAPTILHAFGLPAGADMDGRVLTEAFEGAEKPERIPTWEDEAGIDCDSRRMDAGESDQLLAQFVALGYIEDPTKAGGCGAEDTRRENDWNIACAYIGRGRYMPALPLLERCNHECPGRTDYAQTLAQAYLALEMLAEADAVIERALAQFGPTNASKLLKATIAVRREQWREAEEFLEAVRSSSPDDPRVWLLLAQTQVALRKWDDAEQSARKALEIDPQNPQPYLALARQMLYRKKHEEAIEAALQSIGLEFGNARAHFLLGAALSAQERWEEAIVALGNALKLDPNFVRALRLLSRALRRTGKYDEALGCDHRYSMILAGAKARQRDAVEKFREGAQERKKTYGAPPEPEAEPGEYLIVSGLPRSGTSLMMQILQAGGIGLMADGVRAADADNPEGYWEWEEIKKLARDPRIIEKTGGKAVKVISALLPKLPSRHRYKVIFMLRPIEEVVASQTAMLARQGKELPAETAHLARAQGTHRDEILKFLRHQKQIELLEISYPDLLRSPAAELKNIAAFLGDRFRMSDAVTACIRPDLHHKRALGLAARFPSILFLA